MILYLLWWMPRASSNGLVAVENLETHPRPKYGKTLVNHEISLVFRPAGRVVISHSLLSHGGQVWTCPYILLSLEASALLRQYTRSSLSTGRPGPDQSGAKKAGEPASRGLAWTASRRLDEAEARLDC